MSVMPQRMEAPQQAAPPPVSRRVNSSRADDGDATLI
jgi:hypothetical protein